MDLIERVARSILASSSGSALQWDDMDIITRGSLLSDAKAAIRAMMDGVEPVAWAQSKGGLLRAVSVNRLVDRDRANGWTETPLYSLDALKEAL